MGTSGFDWNVILVPLTVLFGLLSIFSGVFLVLRSMLRFRLSVSQSMNADLEVVKVSRPEPSQGDGQNRAADAWRDEIVAMEQLLASISALKSKGSWWKRLIYHTPSIVFEIANPSTSEEIFFYISVPKRFRESIEKQVHSFFPSAVIEKVPDYTVFSPESSTAVATIGLSKNYALPLRTYRVLEVDPLNEISNSLSRLKTESEGAAVQIILSNAPSHWRSSGREIAQRMQGGKRLRDAHQKSFLHGAGKELGKGMIGVLSAQTGEHKNDPEEKQVALTPEEQEMVKSIEGKSNKAAFQVNIRIIATAATHDRAEEILAQIENSFSQFENPDVNSFKVLRRIKEKQAVFEYIFRTFDEEHSCILGVEELASIFHFPISTTETPKIKWLKSGSSAPPINIPADGLLLGFNDYRGAKTEIRITDNDRRRHLYAIGQTGAGKSNFLQEMAKKDAASGKGFCFIDPHGDAIEDILTAIPKERAEDVIIFDPADVARPIGINMLEYDPTHPEQKTFIINEMIGIFDQLYDLKATGGPMFEQYMRNAMLLIMEHPESGSTLMEISKVLADEDFRRFKLEHCTNPIVRDFWLKEAEKAGGEAALANMVPYITSKLTTFISNDIMRPIIAQQKSALDFRDIMDNGKILLVNLSKGKIGEINAKLLGMVIVGRMLMAALSRVDTPEDERKDFYLYLDEFQNVTTNSIAQILSEARKYRLCLVLAHQFIAQLKEEISKAVFGNVGSMVAFRVGPEDAEFLEKQFAPVFTPNDLMNVDNYNCFARLLMKNELTKPFNMKTYPPTRGNQEIANALKELSRLRFGRDTSVVNREIMERVKLAE